MKIKEILIYIILFVVGTIFALTVLHPEKIKGIFQAKYVEGDFDYYYRANKVSSTETVIMYGTSWCTYCAKTRAFLKENKVKFIDLDIELQSDAKAQYQKLNVDSIPVVLVGNRRIEGFRPDDYKKALNIQ